MRHLPIFGIPRKVDHPVLQLLRTSSLSTPAARKFAESGRVGGVLIGAEVDVSTTDPDVRRKIPITHHHRWCHPCPSSSASNPQVPVKDRTVALLRCIVFVIA